MLIVQEMRLSGRDWPAVLRNACGGASSAGRMADPSKGHPNAVAAAMQCRRVVFNISYFGYITSVVASVLHILTRSARVDTYALIVDEA